MPLGRFFSCFSRVSYSTRPYSTKLSGALPLLKKDFTASRRLFVSCRGSRVPWRPWLKTIKHLCVCAVDDAPTTNATHSIIDFIPLISRPHLPRFYGGLRLVFSFCVDPTLSR